MLALPTPPGPRFALRLLAAALLTTILLAVASVALSVTTAPAPVSLLVEPFSLLLTPGFLLCVPFVRNHNEVSPPAVLMASACLYLVVFAYVLSHWPPARAHSRSR